MARRHKKRKHLKGHRRHGRRRHLRGLGDLKKILHSSSSLSAPLAGAVAGLAVTAGAKLLISNVSGLQNSLPDWVQNNMILVGSALGGVALYFARRKKNHSAALGNLVGALAVGGIAFSWAQLQAANPATFGDVVTLNLANGTVQKRMAGLLMSEKSPQFPPAYAGLIMGDRASGMAGFRGTIVPDNSGTQQGLWSDGFDSSESEDPVEAFMT